MTERGYVGINADRIGVECGNPRAAFNIASERIAFEPFLPFTGRRSFWPLLFSARMRTLRGRVFNCPLMSCQSGRWSI